MPVYNLNRTVTQIPVAAAAGASTDLIAIPGSGMKIYVVSIVLTMAATGTFKFTEGTGPTDLTGAIAVGAGGGIVDLGDGISPVLQTNTANSKLSIVTVGASATAAGWLRYFLAAE